MSLLRHAGLPIAIFGLLMGAATGSAEGAIRPDPSRATADKAPGYKNGCHLGQGESTPRGCVYGDPDAKRTMMLIGDSKARQWLPTLDRYGKARRWRIVAHTKSACSFSQADLPKPGSNRRYTSCLRWNDAMTARLRKDRPDVVVVALYNKHARRAGDVRRGTQRRIAMAKGLRSSWRAATRAGARVVVINSSPYIGTPYPAHRSWTAAQCVGANPADPGVCDVPAGPALGARSVWTDRDRARVLDGMRRTSLVDLNPRLCDAQVCHVVIGDVLMYRDTHHLTATGARALYPYLRNRLDPLL